MIVYLQEGIENRGFGRERYNIWNNKRGWPCMYQQYIRIHNHSLSISWNYILWYLYINDRLSLITSFHLLDDDCICRNSLDVNKFIYLLISRWISFDSISNKRHNYNYHDGNIIPYLLLVNRCSDISERILLSIFREITCPLYISIEKRKKKGTVVNNRNRKP
jgi:hypothetical protein